MNPPVASLPFPRDLQSIPVEQRVRETFGCVPATLAFVALVLSLDVGGDLVAAATTRPNTPTTLAVVLGLLFASLLFGGWEAWRRARRVTLVVTPTGVAINPNGALDVLVHPYQQADNKLSVVNTLREFGLYGLVTVLGFFSLLGSSGRLHALVWTGAFTLGGAMCLASSIWVRAMGRHMMVPRGRGTELVVLRASDVRRTPALR